MEFYFGGGTGTTTLPALKSLVFIALCIAGGGSSAAAELRVGVAGSEPFVVSSAGRLEGISVEIWRALAAEAGWTFTLQSYENVPDALDALKAGKLDVVVGPVSITSERAQSVRFSQPYFQSSLSILSRRGSLTLWQRIEPFFNTAFYYSAGFLLFILTLVGTLVWLAERRAPDTHFSSSPHHGIPSGIWFALVTMSTVGYGDLAPRTRLGRAITGIWILISVVAASSLVATIGSTLTLTGMRNSTIAAAEDLAGKTVAVLARSPGEKFARDYGAQLHPVETLEQGYDLLKNQSVDALVFDRPQMLYFLQHHRDASLAASSAEYVRQNYGFAVALSRIDRIVRARA